MLESLQLSDSQLSGLGEVLYPESAGGNARFTVLWNQILAKMSKQQQKLRVQQASLCKARAQYLKKVLLMQELETISRTGSVMDLDLRELAQRVQVADAIQRLQLPVATITVEGHQKPKNHLLGSTQHWLGVTPKDLLQTCNMSSTSSQAMVAAAVPLLNQALSDRLSSVQQLILSSSWHSSKPSSLHAHLSPRNCALTQTKPDAAHTVIKGSAVLSEPCHTATLDHTLDQAIAWRHASLSSKSITVLLGLHQQLQLCRQVVQQLVDLTHRLQQFTIQEVLGRQQAHSEFFAKLVGEHARSLCHKQQLLEQQLLVMTYDTQMCMALKKIHDELLARAEATQTQLNEVRTSLGVFEAQGPGFHDLVAAYNRVHQELDSAKQTLKTFTDLESELQHRQAAG